MDFSVKRTFADTYSFIWRNKGELAVRTPLPVVLIFFMTITWAMVEATDDAPLLLAAGLVVFVAVIATAMHLAVSWHRLVLYGRDAAGGPLRIRFGGPELKFLGLGILLRVIEKVAETLVGWLGYSVGTGGAMIAAAILFVLLFYFFTRLFLVLPAIAAGHAPAIGRAWGLSRGRTLKLLLAAIAVFAPFFVVMTGLMMALVTIAPVSLVLGMPVYIIAVAVLFATFLSTAYMGLGSRGEEGRVPETAA